MIRSFAGVIALSVLATAAFAADPVENGNG